MITIVYASRATRKMDERALTALLSVARTRNESENVTGLLLYAYESFLQQLEGEETAVDRIFASIQNDPRHGNLRLLSRRPVEARRYDGWAMGFEHPDAEALGERLPGYVPTLARPLVSSELVTSSAVAEALLEESARTASRSSL